ncbi:MAG: hypothetical protein Roseis2KO_18750 [Roseivirga sp.]
MYFSSRLTVDPSQLTRIEKVEPTKAFKRLLHFMTGGAVADKVEHETFAAVSVLQQFNRLFWSLNINNIVRLSHDDIDIYEDLEGRKDDLKEAIDKYELTVNDAMSELFKTIHLVLEHEDQNFIYLIEIDINRSHEVGEYPIELAVNAMLKDFKAREGEDAETLKERMKDIFMSQEIYESFLSEKRASFNGFINQIEMDIRKHIKIDDIKVDTNLRMIVPKEKAQRPKSIRRKVRGGAGGGPIYDGYHGFDNVIFYGLLWSSMAHDHHIHVPESTLMSEEGDVIGDIGTEGMDAGEATLFDDSASYDDRISDFESSSVEMDSVSSDADGGWFSGFDTGDWGDDSSSSCSSCSSCSGCSSCGGD